MRSSFLEHSIYLEEINLEIIAKRQNYRQTIPDPSKEYFDLKLALFALNDFEDGVYHILGPERLQGRIHHLIGLKVEDMLHIFDYAGDGGYKVPLLVPNVCEVKNSYNLKFDAAKVEDIDMKAIFLGKVKQEFEDKGLDPLTELNSYAFKEGGFNNTWYSLKQNNCRHFSHSVAAFLGVESRYLEIVNRENFVWA